MQGGSTRKVAVITEELCGASFSKSTVSALCAGLDARVRAFNERRREGESSLILVDARCLKSREDERIVPRAALIVSGVGAGGNRELLEVRIGDTESFGPWEETFRWLKGRGLTGVAVVVSDEHGGLTQAIARHFQGASWPRCPVHLIRHRLCHALVTVRADVAAAAKRIFQASEVSEAKRQRGEFAERFARSAPKAVACLEAGFDEAMTVMALPGKDRRRLRPTNLPERLNEEIRRRERVIRSFPNDASALRLIGALLAEYHAVWQDRKSLDRDEFAAWATARAAFRIAARFKKGDDENLLLALQGSPCSREKRRENRTKSRKNNEIRPAHSAS